MVIITSEKTGKVLCKIEIFTRTENGKEYTDVKFHPDIYLKDLSNKNTKRKYDKLMENACKGEEVRATWIPSDLYQP